MRQISLMKVLTRLPIILIMVLLLQPLLITFLETAQRGFRWPQDRQVAVQISPRSTSILDRILFRLTAMQAAPLANPGGGTVSFPRWSWESLIAGKFQRPFENWLNTELPFRANMVRGFNQVYYNLFSKSYVNRMIIGKTGQLYQTPYIDNYCNLKQLKYSRPEFKQWVDELRELSEFFTQRGQHFVYLITPSKAAYFPEYIPTQFACPLTGSVRPGYLLATEMLRDAGIPYVDGSKIVLNAKGKFPVDLFPRGGIHWNMLGAALASRELFREISGNLNQPLPKLRFSYVVDNNPKDTDTDLLMLANLWRPNRNYPVPHIKIENVKQGIQQKPTIAIVGGSFSLQVRRVMIESGFFSKIDYFNYFKIFHFTYPESVRPSVDENNPETYRELLEADVVLLEENEQNLRSEYMKLLRGKILHSVRE